MLQEDELNNVLIGLEEKEAETFLDSHGIKNIKVEINSKPNEKCDTKLVCKVKKEGDSIILICGEFYLNIKGDSDGKKESRD